MYNIKLYNGETRKSHPSAGDGLNTVKSVDATIKDDASKLCS